MLQTIQGHFDIVSLDPSFLRFSTLPPAFQVAVCSQVVTRDLLVSPFVPFYTPG